MMLSLGRIHRLKCMNLPIVMHSKLCTLTQVVSPLYLSRYDHNHHSHHHNQYINNIMYRHSSSTSSPQTTPIAIEIKPKRTQKRKVKKTVVVKANNTDTNTSNNSYINTLSNKKHLLLNNDKSHITINNNDDFITFAVNHMMRVELADVTTILNDIDNGSLFNKSFVYRNSLKNDDMHIYRIVIDALKATLSGTLLFPLIVPTNVMIDAKDRLCNAVLDSIKKDSTEDNDNKLEQIQAIATNIVSLIPLSLTNEIVDDVASYTNGNITKDLLSSRLWFKYIKPKSHDANMYYALTSISTLLDIKYKQVTNVEVKALKGTIDQFTAAVHSFVKSDEHVKRCSVNNMKELEDALSKTMNTNNMKSLTMDLQSIRKVILIERPALISKLLAKKPSSLHTAVLNSVQGKGIEFPIYFKLEKSDDDDIEIKTLPQSVAKVLLHIKRNQTKANDDTPEEETLGLAINTYINEMDHNKMALKISKMICLDDNTARSCYKYLRALKSGSYTAIECKQKLASLYNKDRSVYNEINDYLALEQSNDDSLPLQRASMFDQTMLFSELRHFRNDVKKEVAKIVPFSEQNRMENLTNFLSSITVATKKKKLGQHSLYTTIICASIRTETTHIRLNTELEDEALFQSPAQLNLKVPKVFIDNLPSEIDESILRNAFKRCGLVAKLWLYKAPDDFDNNQHISTKVSIEDEFPFVKHKEEESDEEGNDDGDASGSDDDLDEDDNVEKKKKIKKKSYKKKVKRPRKSESYAFVEMTDGEGFLKAIRDENRIFGLCIKSNSCRVQQSGKMRTLYVEFSDLTSIEDSKKMLNNLLETKYELIHEDIDIDSPLFVHLEFVNHEEAWAAFQLLEKGANDGVPLKAHWQKNRFWSVAREELFRHLSKTEY